jgi:nitrite reductase/ring-hydroxylating ferredoxin subunit
MPDNPRRAGVRLCSAAEIPEGEARSFALEGSGRVFAVRRRGAVRVWRDRCPHWGTPLPWRKDVYLNKAGDRVICAAHGAQFDAESGLCILGACLGQSLEAVPFVLTDGEIVLTEYPHEREGRSHGSSG